VLRDPVHWPAFGFGLGLMPFAPGTWGSLLAIPMWWFMPSLAIAELAVGLLVFALAATWICGVSARRLGVHDHGGIVLDEVFGMLLVLLVTPREPAWILASFLLFRLFDIVKPWPIRDLDHSVRGGAGIMLDDVLAAAYAAALVLVAQHAIAVS
jgi:phosphatidylglycerophosphatase A